MKTFGTIIKIVGLVAKYGAVAVAIFKGIEVIHNELKNIDLSDLKMSEDDADK